MLEFVIVTTIISFILIIWFKTDAFVEYCNLFGVNFFLKDYNQSTAYNLVEYINQIGPHVSREKRMQRFFLKLISCPYCVNVWLSLIGSIFLNNILLLPALYILSLFIFFKLKSS